MKVFLCLILKIKFNRLVRSNSLQIYCWKDIFSNNLRKRVKMNYIYLDYKANNYLEMNHKAFIANLLRWISILIKMRTVARDCLIFQIAWLKKNLLINIWIIIIKSKNWNLETNLVIQNLFKRFTEILHRFVWKTALWLQSARLLLNKHSFIIVKRCCKKMLFFFSKVLYLQSIVLRSLNRFTINVKKKILNLGSIFIKKEK